MTSHKFLLISSLLGSSSTLLSAILRQNRRFQTGISSPVVGVVSSLLAQVSVRSEFFSKVDNSKRSKLLTGLFDSYCHQEQDKSIIFETNRMWCSRLPLLHNLFPKCQGHRMRWSMSLGLPTQRKTVHAYFRGQKPQSHCTESEGNWGLQANAIHSTKM